MVKILSTEDMTYEKSLFVKNYNLNAEFQSYRFVLDVKFVINIKLFGGHLSIL